MNSLPRFLAPLLLACASVSVALAEVTLAPLLGDHAVLQRDKPVPVWGRAAPGEKVTVAFAGQKQSATTGADGKWIVFLEPLKTSATGAELTVTGKNTIILRDILVGEVWLCSGQSNMEWTVGASRDAQKEIAAANFPLIRHIKVTKTVSTTPADHVETSGWKAATPQTAGAFTAVGYFFARDIHQKLGVPIGLVNSSWGGTPIESWMSPAALASDPAFKVVGERWEQTLAIYPTKKAAYEASLAKWTAADQAAQATGPAAYAEWQKKNPRPPVLRGPGDPATPTGLFNAMINPLVPYALRGTLWYQGEGNASRAREYRALFTAMIKAWRAHFAQGDTPFYWVSLASFGVPGDDTGQWYAYLREAQTQTLALPQTGQALAIDIGEVADIHPKNKQDVGRRLALLAKNRTYGLVCDDTGPTFVSATREKSALRVRFNHAGGGLVAHDKPVQSLEIAGADRVFHPATAKIEKDTLLVSSPAVKEPVAVRYAWRNAPEANLYGGSGLPAVPFRSDNW